MILMVLAGAKTFTGANIVNLNLTTTRAQVEAESELSGRRLRFLPFINEFNKFMGFSEEKLVRRPTEGALRKSFCTNRR